MALLGCLETPGGRLFSACLGPEYWTPLRNTGRDARAILSHNLLSCALADLLQQKHAVFETPGMRMEEKFQAMESALRLVGAGFPCSLAVQDAFAKLLEMLLALYGADQPKVCVVTSEAVRVHKQARVLLRGMDPQLFIKACFACPRLYSLLCRVVSKWPCSYQDRDLLLERGAAALPGFADPEDIDDVMAATSLGVRLSCGSEHRVLMMEQSGCSDMVHAALQAHLHNDQVLARAVAYFSNMANCDSQRQKLASMDLGPVCRDALDRLGHIGAVQEQALRVLEALDEHAYDGGSPLGPL